jgi:hypothetical protein
MEQRPLPKRFIAVCTTTRPVGAKPPCGAKGTELFLALQHFLDSAVSWKEIVALPTGCLGFCEDAPVAADLACSRLFVKVDKADIPQLATEVTRLTRGDEWISKV